MLAAEAATFEIRKRALVHEVSLAVKPGELLAILGPNGAGKSTLLRMLCGETKTTRGTIALDGRPLHEVTARARAQRLAVLPQQTNVPFALTSLEIVMLGREPHLQSVQTLRDREIAFLAMEAADVLPLAEREFPSLSGGEKARVQLARVLAQIWEPQSAALRFLLLDEPSAALDFGHQHHVLRLVREWADAGVGVVAILHDLNLAAQYADRIAILNCGRLIAEGTPREVLDADTVEAAFGWRARILTHPEGGWPIVVSGTDGMVKR